MNSSRSLQRTSVCVRRSSTRTSVSAQSSHLCRELLYPDLMTFQLEHFSAFKDFALLDTGKGYRLEQWGLYRLARPDPQITWDRHLPDEEWQRADAIFESIGEMGGGWKTRGQLPGA